MTALRRYEKDVLKYTLYIVLFRNRKEDRAEIIIFSRGNCNDNRLPLELAKGIKTTQLRS